jgi:hypothetical protein
MLLGRVLMSAALARPFNHDEIRATAGTGTSVQARYDTRGGTLRSCAYWIRAACPTTC